MDTSLYKSPMGRPNWIPYSVMLLLAVIGLPMTALAQSDADAEPDRADSGITRDVIERAWQKRQSAVKTGRFRWRERTHRTSVWVASLGASKASNSKGDGKSFPAEGINHTVDQGLSFDANRLRCEMNGELPSGVTHSLVRHIRNSTFDGSYGKTSYLEVEPPTESRDFPQGIVDNANRDRHIFALYPVIWAFRILEPSLCPIDPAEFDLHPEIVDLEGHRCVCLKQGDRELWLDVDRDFVIVRYSITQNRVIPIRQADITYVADEVAGWVPSSWDLIAGSPQGISSITAAEMTEIELNPQLPEDEFRLTFPAGTMVSDQSEARATHYIVREDGTHRDIANSELVRHSYRELLANDPARQASTAPSVEPEPSDATPSSSPAAPAHPSPAPSGEEHSPRFPIAAAIIGAVAALTAVLAFAWLRRKRS